MIIIYQHTEMKILVPSSLSEQPSRTYTYKERLFHSWIKLFLNGTNFCKLVSTGFHTELLSTHVFFFIWSKGFPVILKTQLLDMVSKEKKTDGQRTPELSHISSSSNPVLVKISNLAFICLLQLFRKTGP